MHSCEEPETRDKHNRGSGPSHRKWEIWRGRESYRYRRKAKTVMRGSFPVAQTGDKRARAKRVRASSDNDASSGLAV